MTCGTSPEWISFCFIHSLPKEASSHLWPFHFLETLHFFLAYLAVLHGLTVLHIQHSTHQRAWQDWHTTVTSPEDPSQLSRPTCHTGVRPLISSRCHLDENWCNWGTQSVYLFHFKFYMYYMTMLIAESYQSFGSESFKMMMQWCSRLARSCATVQGPAGCPVVGSCSEFKPRGLISREPWITLKKDTKVALFPTGNYSARTCEIHFVGSFLQYLCKLHVLVVPLNASFGLTVGFGFLVQTNCWPSWPDSNNETRSPSSSASTAASAPEKLLMKSGLPTVLWFVFNPCWKCHSLPLTSFGYDLKFLATLAAWFRVIGSIRS